MLETLAYSSVQSQFGEAQALPSFNPQRLPSLRNGSPAAGNGFRWSWACRALERTGRWEIDDQTAVAPAPGDLVVARVAGIGAHSRIMTADNQRLRIYPGDLIVGVFGNRYATDAFEAEVRGVDDLSLVTGGGMIATVKSRHKDISKPTTVAFLGFLNDHRGRRINLKSQKFVPAFPQRPVNNLIVVVGTSMNSGKTTASAKLIKGLVDRGLRVAACKLTGSVSNRDQDEMRSAAPILVTDFSDYGFPSTYLCAKDELIALFHTMLAEVEKHDPDVVVMEVADGILQRETAMLLEDPAVRAAIKGLTLTARSGMSAIYAVERLLSLGHTVIAVSGAMTSSPLSTLEFQAHCDIPVGSSADSGRELTEIVSRFIGREQ